MKIPALILFLLVFFSATKITTSQSSWSRVTPTPQENHINDITKIPGTNKIIAVCEGSTIMISEDLGETWQLILNPGGLANHVPLKTIYFFNSTIGYIGGRYYDFSNSTYHSYILKTTDGGINWVANINLPGTGYQETNDFYFVNPVIGFAPGYHGKLLKTTDGGENWFDIESGVTFTLYSIDFYNDSSGYIVGSSVDSVLKTTDYGNTWTKEIFNSPLTSGSLEKIQFVSNTTGFVVQHFGDILKTTNAGAGWGIVFTDEDINANSIDFFDENHGIAGCYKDFMQSCILTTHDGGNTWSEFTLPEFQWDSYSVCCMETTQFLFCGNQGMVYKSSDGGNTWDPKFERDFRGNIYQVQYLEDNTIFCLTTKSNNLQYYNYSQLNKSENGGESFTPILNIAINGYNMQTAVAFHFLNSNLGYLTYYHYENLLTVLKTVDGGNTWEEIESGNFDDKPYAVQFYDEYNGLISGLGFILKTSNGGNNWEKVYSFYLFYDLMDIHYFDANEVVVAGGGYSNTVLINSNDGGATWEEMPLGLYGTIYDMEVINNSIYLACGDNVILKSPDIGNTWQYTQINNPNDIEFHSIHFPTESIGFAVGSGNFETAMKTTDGGDTWEVIETGTTAGLNAVHFENENIGYIYCEKGLVLKTTNGGTTFINESAEERAKNHITAFPNPFVNSLTIQYSNLKGYESCFCEVIDPHGKQIINKRLTGISGRIDLTNEDLKPGIYFIILKNETEILETQKIIKLN